MGHARRARFFPLLPLLAIAACTRHVPPPIPSADARLAGIEQRKDALLLELADCESGGVGLARSSGYLGRYQFSTVTVISYVRERDGRAISAAEARTLALDDAQAGALARYVIFERDGHAQWPACSCKLGLPARVAEIKGVTSP